MYLDLVEGIRSAGRVLAEAQEERRGEDRIDADKGRDSLLRIAKILCDAEGCPRRMILAEAAMLRLGKEFGFEEPNRSEFLETREGERYDQDSCFYATVLSQPHRDLRLRLLNHGERWHDYYVYAIRDIEEYGRGDNRIRTAVNNKIATYSVDMLPGTSDKRLLMMWYFVNAADAASVEDGLRRLGVPCTAGVMVAEPTDENLDSVIRDHMREWVQGLS